MLLNMSATNVYVPRVSHSCPLPPQETLQDQQVGMAQAPIKLLLLACVQVYMRLCATFKNEVSFPPSLVELLQSNPTGLQRSGGSSSQCWTPSLGGLMWG